MLRVRALGGPPSDTAWVIALVGVAGQRFLANSTRKRSPLLRRTLPGTLDSQPRQVTFRLGPAPSGSPRSRSRQVPLGSFPVQPQLPDATIPPPHADDQRCRNHDEAGQTKPAFRPVDVGHDGFDPIREEVG